MTLQQAVMHFYEDNVIYLIECSVSACVSQSCAFLLSPFIWVTATQRTKLKLCIGLLESMAGETKHSCRYEPPMWSHIKCQEIGVDRLILYSMLLRLILTEEDHSPAMFYELRPPFERGVEGVHRAILARSKWNVSVLLPLQKLGCINFTIM